MKKSSITILVLATLATSILADCANNCSSCGVKDGSNYCFICEGATWKDGSCSGKSPDHCKYHSAAGCLTCQPGYILSRDNFTCSKAGDNQIKNCTVQWSQQISETETAYGCNVCNKSAPSADQKSCSQDVPKGCLWGGLDTKKQVNCVKCSSNAEFSVQGTCVGSFLNGCLIANNKSICVQCKEGWFMTLPGLCSKEQAIEDM